MAAEVVFGLGVVSIWWKNVIVKDFLRERWLLGCYSGGDLVNQGRWEPNIEPTYVLNPYSLLKRRL